MNRTRQKATSIEEEEILRLLRITKKNILEETRTLEIVSSNISKAQILVVLVETIPETVILKNIVSNLEYFDENQTKFKDW